MYQFADDPDIPGTVTVTVTGPDVTASTGIATDAVDPAGTAGDVHTPLLYPAGLDVTRNPAGIDTVTGFDGVVPANPRNDTLIVPVCLTFSAPACPTDTDADHAVPPPPPPPPLLPLLPPDVTGGEVVCGTTGTVTVTVTGGACVVGVVTSGACVVVGGSVVVVVGGSVVVVVGGSVDGGVVADVSVVVVTVVTAVSTACSVNG